MKLTIIKWRDIPTQVMIKKSRREVEKIQLDNRFMEAVDSAATIADATGIHQSIIAGGDPQLERAIVEITRMIREEPRRLPSRPAPPVKTP